MYEVATIGSLARMGAVDPAEAAADQIFSGCQNRTEVAGFIAAMAFERQVKGLGWGLLLGLVGGAALYHFYGAAFMGHAKSYTKE